LGYRIETLHLRNLKVSYRTKAIGLLLERKPLSSMTVYCVNILAKIVLGKSSQ
jgi:hypothetical protein